MAKKKTTSRIGSSRTAKTSAGGPSKNRQTKGNKKIAVLEKAKGKVKKTALAKAASKGKGTAKKAAPRKKAALRSVTAKRTGPVAKKAAGRSGKTRPVAKMRVVKSVATRKKAVVKKSAAKPKAKTVVKKKPSAKKTTTAKRPRPKAPAKKKPAVKRPASAKKVAPKKSAAPKRSGVPTKKTPAPSVKAKAAAKTAPVKSAPKAKNAPTDERPVAAPAQMSGTDRPSAPPRMSKAALKQRYQMEFYLNATPGSLYDLISSPSGFSEWFCDDVDVSGEMFTFKWGEESEAAECLSRKFGELVRFRWMDEAEEDPGAYFELRIRIDPMTNETCLVVTDHAWPQDLEEAKALWDSQIHTLTRVLGA
jgi:hypothetical protein